jgi:hypothetical protein
MRVTLVKFVLSFKTLFTILIAFLPGIVGFEPVFIIGSRGRGWLGGVVSGVEVVGGTLESFLIAVVPSSSRYCL